MNPREYFALTVITLDRQKAYFRARDTNALNELKKLEEMVLDEVVRVAMLDKDTHKYIDENCPEISAILRLKEVQKQIEIKFEGEVI